MPLDVEILGHGIYSPRQAARLIGSTAQEVRRWTRGSGPTEPLWSAYYQPMDDTAELSFADLIEVRVVRALRKQGISLQAIRYAIRVAEGRFGVKRPLSSKQFFTDGKEILMEAIEDDGEYVSLHKHRPGQKVFSKLVNQSLVDLEYEDGVAARWRPTRSGKVVIDPQRSFGAPIIDQYGVSTGTIFEEYEVFKDMSYLEKIYEIPKNLIREAVKFEWSLQLQGDGKGTVRP